MTTTGDVATERSATLPSQPTRRRGDLRGVVGAVAVVAILVASALVMFGMPSASASALAGEKASSSAVGATAAKASGASAVGAVNQQSSSAPSGLRLSPHPTGSPVASGRGTFLDGSNLSQPGLGNLSCFKYYYFSSAPTCPNTTFDPSINVTSTGEIGVAFTAFTDVTHCPGVANVTNNTTLDVAFQSSSNAGASWSNIVWLGNQNCSEAQNWSNAWQPSLTSLSNGTLVVTYTLFSVGHCASIYCIVPRAPEIFPYEMPYSALVVQESYNGGTTWTVPQVLNQTYNANAVSGTCFGNAWPAYRPWVTASGSNVFLVWENLSDQETCSSSMPFSSGINYVYSSNGGLNWSSPVELPTFDDGGNPVFGSYQTSYSVNPYILAASNGQVYVTYGSGLGYVQDYCEPSGCYQYGIYTQDLIVANATGGTGNWTVHEAAKNIAVNYYGGSGNSYGPFGGLNPQIAYNGINQQLYVVYNSLSIGTFCYYYSGGSYCYSNEYEDVVTFQNSSNGGANWSQPTEIGNMVNPYGGPENAEYYPTVTVDHNGTAHVTFDFYNATYCVTITYYYCGGYQQEYVNSTDDGTTWNGPFEVSAYFVPPTDYAYTGEYETSTTAPSGAVDFAWTNSQCPTSTFCDYLYGVEPNTTVLVSWLYAGTGITLTFTETNLTASMQWAANVLGNYRQAAGGTNLVVSGVPPTEPVYWSVPWVNISFGLTWESIASPTNPIPPTTVATSTTLAFTFQEYALLTVDLNPPIDTYYVTAGYNEGTYSVTPTPGLYWLPVNSTTTLTVAPQSISCTSGCYYYNLSWVSWTGTGPGAVSSNATTITVTVGVGPINETANFLVYGYCDGYSGTLYCYSTQGYPLSFHETGLPSGTSWGLTVVENSTANGTVSSTSSTSWLNESTGQTAVQYTIWTVPDGTTGMYWVPTSDPASPVKEPTQTLVNVTYALVSPSTMSFTANFSATGLPNGTAWSAEVGSGSFAVTEGNLTVTVPGGTALNLSGAPVYTEGGVGYYASSVSVFPYVVNTTWTNTTSLPDSYTFDGSARVFVTYSPEFWLTVSASSGGNVTPSSEWVPTGNAVALTATADSGYHFLDWASVGAGGTTVAQEHNTSPTIHPSAPVSEFATFRKDPALTWNVTVMASGLPTTTGFTFTLGNTTYTGSGGRVTVGNLSSGPYGFGTAVAYANGTDGTRWVPTSWTTSYPTVGGMLTIGTNGTIQVNFTTEYVLTVAATPDGTVTSTVGTPALGSTWQSAGTVVTLTAAPLFHYKFGGWNASGSGSVAGMSPSITVTLAGPVWESASFVYRVFPPPALYWLNVTETGLPAGVSWNISAGVGNSSAAGSGTSLTLLGLNGTYTLIVPAVYVGLGTRYVVANPPPVPVTSNGSTSVTFTKEYAYTVSASVGGTVTGAGTTWVASGASETLSATPSTGYQFANWTGTGTGSATAYTGPTASGQSVTVSGPTNETATFVPIQKKVVTGSATAGQIPALGILAALLVVGLVVGLIVGSRRSGKPPATSEEPDGGATPEGGADDTYGGTGPMNPPEGASGAGAPEYEQPSS